MKQKNTNFKSGLPLAFCLILAQELILDGAMKAGSGKSTPDHSYYITRFVSRHYPAWLPFVTGAFGLLSAFFLLSPRTRFRRTSILLILSAGVILTYIFNRNALGKNSSLPVRLLLTGIMIWITRPAANPYTHPVGNYFNRH